MFQGEHQYIPRIRSRRLHQCSDPRQIPTWWKEGLLLARIEEFLGSGTSDLRCNKPHRSRVTLLSDQRQKLNEQWMMLQWLIIKSDSFVRVDFSLINAETKSIIMCRFDYHLIIWQKSQSYGYGVIINLYLTFDILSWDISHLALKVCSLLVEDPFRKYFLHNKSTFTVNKCFVVKRSNKRTL